MHDPIEVLMAEHRVIESMLDALEAYGERASAGTPLPVEDLRAMCGFFVEYADELHHAKEEKILFEAMAAAGFPRHAGPIAVMLHEHELGRGLVRRLAGLAERGDWSDADRGAIFEAATSFAGMLRAHIMKEDQVLYTMARSQLGAEAMSEVAARVAAVVERDPGTRFVESAARLRARYCG